MRNLAVWLAAAVGLLSIGGAGCTRSGRAQDLAALDRAYQSGVLSRDEYDAKKAGLESEAAALDALDRSVATGIVASADYPAIKARLIAQGGAVAALERAHRTGVLTGQEYLVKKAELMGAPSHAAPSAAPPSQDEAVAAMQTKSVTPRPIAAPDGLKTIDSPGGGKIAFGQVPGQTTEAGAMGAVLRSLHDQLGERPQVGKLFQVRGTQSVAAFFSVGARTGRIAGLIVAAKVTNDRVEAALITDEAARFPKTLSPMMKTLFSAWHPLEAAGAAGSQPGAPQPLHPLTLPDRSASVSLPDGWKVVPSMSSMGTIVAAGPKDESAELGIAFLASDTNNPRVQQLLHTLRNGGLRNTAYATGTYYPYGADLSKTFVDLMQNLRHKAQLLQATYKFSSVAPVPGPAPERCVRMMGTVDLGDGKGARELNAVYCTTPPTPAAGVWLSVASMTTAPIAIAAGERATLGAIMASFNVNQSVVNAQSANISGPAIERIHAIGKAAANQAAAAHERNEIQNSSVYQRWDSLDKRSQEFENYQLGFSVISDTENNYHGTFWNDDAELLVKSNPDRFEYVSAPNYWKGIDY